MKTRRTLIFAVPGAITQATGGTIYDRRVLEELCLQGWDARHLALPDSFPCAPPDDMDKAFAALEAVPAGQVLVIDGLAFATLDTERLARLAAPLIAMIHHPVGLEAGLSAATARRLLASERRNLGLAQHIIVPSPHTFSILKSRFGVPEERMTIARPGLGPVPIANAARASPPLILSVGILAERKGHDVLLQALAGVRDLAWRAMIVGRTQQAETARALHAQVFALGLQDRVLFAGEVADSELGTLYGAASLFALATRYEGYGIVFGEAMRAGLPIVSCTVGAVPDTVPTEAGLLVPPDDPPAFSRALRRLLSEPMLRQAMEQGSACHGRTLPGWAQTAEIFAGVAGRLLATR